MQPYDIRDEARHLVWMALLPGELAMEHAKLREKQLMASDPMFSVLPELIRQERAAARQEKA